MSDAIHANSAKVTLGKLSFAGCAFAGGAAHPG
jgi:uncharacterized membrane protein